MVKIANNSKSFCVFQVSQKILAACKIKVNLLN